MTTTRSSLRGVACVLAAVLAVTAVAPRGFADAYDAAMARAIAAKEKAIDSNDPAAWDEALRLFIEADAIKPTKDSKYEVANAAVKLKEDDLAFEAYENAIALGLSGKPKEKAQTFLAAHQSIMARLDVRGPAGAEVFIGPRSRGTLPRPPIVVFAGPVKLKVVASGRVAEESMTVKEGVTVGIDLSAKLAPPPPATAPAASASATAPSPGDTAAVPLGDTGAGARTLGWSLVVTGGVLTVGAAVGVFVTGRGLDNRLAALRAHCQTFKTDDPDQCAVGKPEYQAAAQSDNDAIATWKGVRTASWVTGGVGLMILGVGLLRLATAPAPPKASAFQPTFTVGMNGAYVGLGGAF
ncbi:MAG: hypothetical protein HYV09_39035 [Deltaproteobacteria bacterium]|nr:hypothetical protein [Deltaproteobacteria bacterium]